MVFEDIIKGLVDFFENFDAVSCNELKMLEYLKKNPVTIREDLDKIIERAMTLKKRYKHFNIRRDSYSYDVEYEQFYSAFYDDLVDFLAFIVLLSKKIKISDCFNNINRDYLMLVVARSVLFEDLDKYIYVYGCNGFNNVLCGFDLSCLNFDEFINECNNIIDNYSDVKTPKIKSRIIADIKYKFYYNQSR